ncbi:FK506-binding protein 59 isoform X1 [Microplitis demolitor]|uniref:FK506-binding protein 59 isoform X1 n=2 Tax=Microplitis demolitor TaxID=69319 RepID=UPI00043FFF05|nr:FK506-binding protein 59 isoform X1 [Microplitis demolitor]
MAVDISPKNDGGVLKEIIKEGLGEETPSPGSKVKVHYTGTLLDGSKFDSSKDRNEPFEFNLAQGNVIKAWDIGVATMKKGEVAILTCAPEYAYGKSGSPPKIPPDATLKFEVEVLDWVGEDLSPNLDASIQRFQIVSGSKEDGYPNDGALVDIHLVGKYNDRVFEERDVKFNLGEGEDVGIIEGVESALSRFAVGEKSRLLIKSKFAFKKTGHQEFNIPPDADVEYIVEMKAFEKAADIWSMEPETKIEQAKLSKDKATNYFKAGKYPMAIKMCKKVVEFLESESTFDDKLKPERNQVLLSAHLNLGLFYLKTNDNFEAKNACTKALDIDPSNEKALFRRGQALLALSQPEEAKKDFEQVIKVEPNNTAAVKQIAVCRELIMKNRAQEKKLYANMFEKMARADKQKEEEILRRQPDVMQGTLGEWGQEERPGGRDATAFEKENPNILMLNANGTGEFQNM